MGNNNVNIESMISYLENSMEFRKRIFESFRDKKNNDLIIKSIKTVALNEKNLTLEVIAIDQEKEYILNVEIKLSLFKDFSDNMPFNNQMISSVELNGDMEEVIKSDRMFFDIDYWSYNIQYNSLADIFEAGDFIVPKMQRAYVWDDIQASKLIESIIMGLPLPSLFLIKQEDEKYIIVDGLQRITTIASYILGHPLPNRKGVFKLKGVNDQINGKTFEEIKTFDEKLTKKMERKTINVIEFKQNKPEYEDSIYYLFERLNSGGTNLSPQQIRNSIYYGYFNDRINKFSDEIMENYFSEKEKANMIPAEVTLRCLTIYDLIKPDLDSLLSLKNKKSLDNINKSYVYKKEMSKKAEKEHMNHRILERKYVLNEGSNEGFEESKNFIEYKNDIDNQFRKIEKIFETVTNIFGTDSFKRYEKEYLFDDKNQKDILISEKFKSRSTPIIIEATVITLLYYYNQIGELNNHSEIVKRFKELIPVNYEEYFNQATGKVGNILKRIGIISKIYFGDDNVSKRIN